MMKKRTKIIVILTALVLILGAVGIFSFAFESDPERSDYVKGKFLYYDASTETTTLCNNSDFRAKMAAIDNGDVIKLLSDLTFSNTLKISETDGTDPGVVDTFYIDLNGYELVTRYKNDNSSPYILTPDYNTRMYIYTSHSEDTARICACSDYEKKTAIFNPRFDNAKIFMCSPEDMPIITNGSNEVSYFKAQDGQQTYYVNTFAPVLVDSYINLAGSFNPLETSITIDGGCHYQVDVAAPLFTLSAGVDIYAKNAKFISLTGSNIISCSRGSASEKTDKNGNKIYVYSASGDSDIVMENCLLFTDGLIGSNLYEADAEPDRLVDDSYIKFTNCTLIGSEVQTVKKGEPEYIGCSFGTSVVSAYGQTLVRDNRPVAIPVYGYEKRTESGSVYIDTPRLNDKIVYIRNRQLVEGDATVEITWIDENKNEVTETWIKSDYTVPAPPPVTYSTELYTHRYFPTPEATAMIDGSATYIAKPVINFGIMANMILESDFTFNLYLPAWAGDSALMKEARIETLDKSGNVVSATADFSVKGELVTIELNPGVFEDYYVIRKKISASVGDTNYRLVLNMGDSEKAVSYNRDFSIFDYAERVREGAYSTSAVALVNAAENYIKATTNYKDNGTDYDVTVDDAYKAGNGTQMSELPAFLKKVYLSPQNEIKFLFMFDANATGSVTFSYTKHGDAASTTIDIDELDTYFPYYDNDGNLVYDKDGEPVWLIYHELPIFAQDLRTPIAIDYGSDGSIDYTYSFDNYVYDAKGTNDDKLITLVDAMHAYSKCAEKYATTGGKDTPSVNLSINGKRISGNTHAIIADEANKNEYAAALSLKSAILVKTGETLLIYSSEAEAPESISNYVYVTVEAPNLSYDMRASVEGGNLVISGYNSFISSATSMFIAEYISPLNKNYDFAASFIDDYFSDKIYYSDFGIKGLDVDAAVSSSIHKIIEKLAQEDADEQIKKELNANAESIIANSTEKAISKIKEEAATKAKSDVEAEAKTAAESAIEEGSEATYDDLYATFYAEYYNANYESYRVAYEKSYTTNYKTTYRNEFVQAYKKEYSNEHRDSYTAIHIVKYQNEKATNELIEKYKDTDLWHTYALAGIKEAITIDDTLNAISQAHKHANLAKRHTVYADDNAVYYFNTAKLTTSNQILIDTSVVLDSAKFIFDDSEVRSNGSTDVFVVKSSLGNVKINDSAILDKLVAEGVGTGTKKLDLGLGYKAMIIVVNEEARVYRRRGYGQWNGTAQKELVVIDENGNVDPSTPFMFDYPRLDYIEVYNIESSEITISGGSVTTVVPTLEKAIGVGRGLLVSRANVTVDGMKHNVIGEFDNEWEQNDVVIDGDNLSSASYSGFYTTDYACNVLFKNCTLQGRRSYANGSTYEVSLVNSNNVTFDYCNQTNFYVDADTHLPVTEETEDTILSMSDGACWGAAGTNFCKNLTYSNSNITRFDAHQGLYNGNIINCDIQGIEIVGFGEFNIVNTNIYKYGSGIGAGNSLIHLRSDYGRTWCGTITFKDVDVYHYETGTATGTYPTEDHPEYTGPTSHLLDNQFTNWYYGYDCYVPNVVVDGIEYYSQIQTKGLPEEDHIPLSAEAVGAIHIFNHDYKTKPNVHLPDTGNINAYYPIIDEDGDGYIDYSDTFYSATTTVIYYNPSSGKYAYSETGNYTVKIEIEPGKGIKIDQFNDVVIEDGIYVESTANRNPLVPPESIMILNNYGGYDFGTNLNNYLSYTSMFDNTLMIEGYTTGDSIEVKTYYNKSATHKCDTVLKSDDTKHWYECKECYERYDEANHVFDNACDRICDDCEYERDVSHNYNEGWSNNSTAHWHECSKCGDKKDLNEHSYTGNCDADCNECGYERTIEHKYEDEWSKDENSHWHECEYCDSRNSEEEHGFENGCDTTCDDCGYERTIEHKYDDEWSKDADTHWHECSECGDKKDLNEHSYTGNCDEYCNECGYERTIEHKYEDEWSKDENSHWHECEYCDSRNSEEEHGFENGCDTTCDDCGYERTTEHEYEDEWSRDENSHWHECSECGVKKDEGTHDYSELGNTCSGCGLVKPKDYDAPFVPYF